VWRTQGSHYAVSSWFDGGRTNNLHESRNRDDAERREDRDEGLGISKKFEAEERKTNKQDRLPFRKLPSPVGIGSNPILDPSYQLMPLKEMSASLLLSILFDSLGSHINLFLTLVRYCLPAVFHVFNPGLLVDYVVPILAILEVREGGLGSGRSDCDDIRIDLFVLGRDGHYVLILCWLYDGKLVSEKVES
jgi:hypothetical protein